MNESNCAPRMHFFTVDVEEYFHVSAFEAVVSPAEWERYPSRIESSVAQILELLAKYDATGTFFILGWVAERHPGLVRRITAAGHEVASHGWWHRRVTTLSPTEFRAEVRDSRALIEDLAGRPVFGFRAPSFSIVPGREWAFDVLIEEGYRYDSSLFPISRKGYGYPTSPTEPHLIRRETGTLIELPPATTRFLGARVPAAGGGYLRQLPFGVIRRAFAERSKARIPGMFYIHPWELDPGQPRLPVGVVTRLRHYRALQRTAERVEQLLREFRFSSVERMLGLEPGVPSAVPRPMLVP